MEIIAALAHTVLVLFVPFSTLLRWRCVLDRNWSLGDTQILHMVDIHAPVDHTALFWSACRALRPGTLVAAAGASLVQIMNALQIGDPAMDSGMAWPAELLPASERTPNGAAMDPGIAPLDVPPSLTTQDLVWTMDRMFACEIAWLRGASLLQTIYTCTYFGYHVYGGAAVPDDPSHHTLLTYLRATGAGVGIVWHELTKNNVVDGEDFHSDPGVLPPPDVPDVRELLEELGRAVDVPAFPPEVTLRLHMRRLLLQLYDAAHQQVPDHSRLHALVAECAQSWAELASQLCDTALASAPPTAQAFYDITLSRKLSAYIPLRPEAPPSADATAQLWSDVFARDWPFALRLIEHDNVLEWLDMLQRQAIGSAPFIPYIRSLMCTFICDGLVVWGAKRELEHLAQDPIKRVCNWSAEDAGVRLEWWSHRSGDDLSLRLGRFIQRFAGLVAQCLAAFAQNRARQKRALAKSYGQWAELADDAAELDEAIAQSGAGSMLPPNALHTTVRHFALVQLRHIVCSGFELELYGHAEWACMYWLAAEICDEHVLLCQDIGPSFAWTAAEARALRELCRALAHLLHESDSSEHGFLVFARRVKWLRQTPWTSTRIKARGNAARDQIYALWYAWLAEAKHLDPAHAAVHLADAGRAIAELESGAEAPHRYLCAQLAEVHRRLTDYAADPGPREWRTVHPWLLVPI